ncbi:MAG: hypothetical protein ACK40O_04245 [Allosphingosinicella sp.]
MLLYLLLQSAAAPPPDIQLDIDLKARSVEIERRGEAALTVRAEPDGGSAVEAATAPAPEGRRKLRNVRVKVRGEARIAPPAQIGEAGETPAPQ